MEHAQGGRGGHEQGAASAESPLKHEDAIATGSWHFSMIHHEGMASDEITPHSDEHENHQCWIHILQ